jgi:hypothetical protein
LSRRRRLSDRFLTAVVEKRKKIESSRSSLMTASVYTSTRYLTPLLNSHQTDTNRENNFTGFSFTAILLWFDGLKTKRLHFSFFFIENPLSSSFFTDPQWDARNRVFRLNLSYSFDLLPTTMGIFSCFRFIII